MKYTDKELLEKIEEIEEYNLSKIEEYENDSGSAFTEGELVTLKTETGEETSIYLASKDQDHIAEVNPLSYYKSCDFDRFIAEAKDKGALEMNELDKYQDLMQKYLAGDFYDSKDGEAKNIINGKIVSKENFREYIASQAGDLDITTYIRDNLDSIKRDFVKSEIKKTKTLSDLINQNKTGFEAKDGLVSGREESLFFVAMDKARDQGNPKLADELFYGVKDDFNKELKENSFTFTKKETGEKIEVKKEDLLKYGNSAVLKDFKELFEDQINFIYDQKDLKSIKDNPEGNYQLMNDIDFEGAEIEHINYDFKGVLDGNGHEIKNFEINDPNKNSIALFDTNLGEIKNLNLNNFRIKGNKFTGSIVSWNEGKLENIQTKGEISGKNYVGGIVGVNKGKGEIIKCKAEFKYEKGLGTVTGYEDVGGIAGSNSAKIENCQSTAGIYGDKNIGGISGSNKKEIQNCITTGDVVGWNNGEIKNSYTKDQLENRLETSKSLEEYKASIEEGLELADDPKKIKKAESELKEVEQKLKDLDKTKIKDKLNNLDTNQKTKTKSTPTMGR